MENPSQPKLWNPQAVAFWSILFSPIFGAYIFAKNWTELGKPDEARQSMMWVYGGIIWTVVVGIFVGIFSIKLFITMRLFEPLLLFTWIVMNGQKQLKYVREGISYERQSWGMVLPLGLCTGVAYNFTLTYLFTFVRSLF